MPAYASAILSKDDASFSARLELEKLLSYEVIDPNILILDFLAILPWARGHRIGILALRRIIERFDGGTGVVAMKPWPLQFCDARSVKGLDGWWTIMALGTLDPRRRAATPRLRRHYAQLGFVHMRGTDFLFRSTAWRLPTVDELLSTPAKNARKD